MALQRARKRVHEVALEVMPVTSTAAENQTPRLQRDACGDITRLVVRVADVHCDDALADTPALLLNRPVEQIENSVEAYSSSLVC